jgi:dephospho-CoA kinase
MKHKKSILQIGVTGGIGAGKSEVCQIFEQLGVEVLYADEIAMDLSNSDRGVRTRIRRAFGSRVFGKDGSIDRRMMAKLVFANKGLRKKLDSIIHPEVFEFVRKRINRIRTTSGESLVVIEAALIYETGMEKELDYVIVVEAAEGLRIRRVRRRDGCSRDDVIRRIVSQMPTLDKLHLADFVIMNDGSRKELSRKVTFLYNLLKSISQNRVGVK